MASIFTFEPEPPRVSSPWLRPDEDAAVLGLVAATPHSSRDGRPIMAMAQDLEGRITKIAAEPQAGPTEYKLHLLLRPRRKYTSSTTGKYTPGPHRTGSTASYDSSSPRQLDGNSSICVPSEQSRQSRLQQLTTQLLWRLQQSLPHHSPSATNGVSLSSVRRDPRMQRGGFLPGLEESHGALYEIGVSDEGMCIGLTHDELDESLKTLRVMAESLGCAVHVQRLVTVGSCEWMEESKENPEGPERLCRGKLWVAEALVKPDLRKFGSGWNTENAGPSDQPSSTIPRGTKQYNGAWGGEISPVQPQQLRVSLTGTTNSGKSSLLGTLSSSTLDNGRGRSRLCLLRHRHELESGLTSSVAHELIGYTFADPAGEAATEVVNYASGNISSWTDIHVSSQCSRLVFFSDSAGHPRYRRTAIRGLVGWAPHWAALCVAADGEIDAALESRAQPLTGDPPVPSGTALGLTSAHLKLCLDLQLPLMVIVTKLDVASKPTLKNILGAVLSNLKAAGRKPIILPTRGGGGKQVSPEELQTISVGDDADAERAIEMIHEYGLKVAVPVVLTSAVQGTGITSIHALLRKLPIPVPVTRATPQEPDLQATGLTPSALFHIEDVFALPSSFTVPLPSNTLQTHEHGSVISGHLSHGIMSVGDELFLGPFPVDDVMDEPSNGDDNKPHHEEGRTDDDRNGLRRPFSQALSVSSERVSTRFRRPVEWRRMCIISIRNLRLPTSKLLSGQVGSIGLVPLPTGNDQAPASQRSDSPSSSAPAAMRIFSAQIRKGMVLAQFESCQPQSFGGFVGVFPDLDPGKLNQTCPVIVYFASVRAAAKITKTKVIGGQADVLDKGASNEQAPVLGSGDFSQTEDDVVTKGGTTAGITEIAFRFLGCREWIELGVQVLIMPSGVGVSSESVGESAGLLDGFVGKIVQATV